MLISICTCFFKKIKQMGSKALKVSSCLNLVCVSIMTLIQCFMCSRNTAYIFLKQVINYNVLSLVIYSAFSGKAQNTLWGILEGVCCRQYLNDSGKIISAAKMLFTWITLCCLLGTREQQAAETPACVCWKPQRSLGLQ